MDMKISKELLSIILGEKAYDIKCVSDNIISFYTDYDQYEEINIYELAHKCKVWAYKQGYSLKSEYAEKYSSCGIYLKDDFSYELDGSIMQTEVEAVIEACQLILDNQK